MPFFPGALKPGRRSLFRRWKGIRCSFTGSIHLRIWPRAVSGWKNRSMENPLIIQRSTGCLCRCLRLTAAVTAPDTGKGIEQAAADRDSSFRIHVALHALEEPYREIFELRIFGELSFREIGTIFGKTENWARVTYYRAKQQLIKEMKQS